MGILDSVLSATPVIRRWWWRQKWTSLNVPAAEWAKMDDMVEDMYDALQSVKSLDKLIMDAATLSAGHGMNTTLSYTDASGKSHAVKSVIGGSSATTDLLKSYQKQMDARRKEMMKLFVVAGNWAADNAVVRELEEKTPIHVSLIAFVRNVRRIALELSEARQGRTPEEFLRYALLDRDAHAERLAIAPTPRVKLKKPESAPAPRKPKAEPGTDRRKIVKLLPTAFSEQGVDARFVSFKEGCAVTRYRIKLEAGQKLSKAENIAPEIASRLGVQSVSITAAPDEAQILYVDVPNKDAKPLLFADVPRKAGKFFIGESIDGKPVFTDMEELCHALIAGTTGSGKSTFLNSIICSMLREPLSEVRFLMIDPKQVELTPYDGTPHLWRPVVTEPEEAATSLDEAVSEMERRYTAFREIGVKKLSEYNERAEQFQADEMPRLIIVIDELADLMMASGKEVEASIIRIAQKGRAAGLHLLIATQRPTVDVVTGMIKANIPSRIAFAVASALESRIILDTNGAEKLIGKGDMLYKPNGGKTQRLQSAYISGGEIARIVETIKEGT